MNEINALQRELLRSLISQWPQVTLIGAVFGGALEALSVLFRPSLERFNSVIAPEKLSFLAWVFIGIFLYRIAQFFQKRKLLSGARREILDLVEELTDKAKLTQPEKKQYYRNLLSRIAKEADLLGKTPTGEALRKIAEEEEISASKGPTPE